MQSAELQDNMLALKLQTTAKTQYTHCHLITLKQKARILRITGITVRKKKFQFYNYSTYIQQIRTFTFYKLLRILKKKMFQTV